MTVAAGARRSSPPRHWAGAAIEADAFAAKADALAALASAGAPVDSLRATRSAPDYYHPGRSGALGLGPNALAYFGEVHPGVLKRMDIEGPIAAFEILLDRIPTPKVRATKTRSALDASDLLPVMRDFAFIVDDSLPAEDIVRATRGAEKKLISAVRVFDVYRGAGVADDKKSIAVEVELQPREKTLTDDEIAAVAQRIVAAVEKATGGALRS